MKLKVRALLQYVSNENNAISLINADRPTDIQNLYRRILFLTQDRAIYMTFLKIIKYKDARLYDCYAKISFGIPPSCAMCHKLMHR